MDKTDYTIVAMFLLEKAGYTLEDVREWKEAKKDALEYRDFKVKYSGLLKKYEEELLAFHGVR